MYSSVAAAMLLLVAIEVRADQPASGTSNDYTVACYYFPNYHPNDARNRQLKGNGWSEWELVRQAKPRFDGHLQPKAPLWGYTDESDPEAMAQKIDAAADHGIDAFIFDWYWYNDGPFLERGLDKGFLEAPNNDRLKFALMWANHDWKDIHPYTRGTPPEVLYPGSVSQQTFNTIVDQCIDKYFSHPSYWRIDGKPYFSVYHISKLIESFGGVEATRKALDKFRAKCRDAGFPGVHLNQVVWGQPILPGEGSGSDYEKLVDELGFDSVTSYVWIHHVHLPDLETDYAYVKEKYLSFWDDASEKFDVPYYPNVTVGWDASARADQSQLFGNYGYPFMNTISGNTPDQFRQALTDVRLRMDRQAGPRILNINCWNEWTEGSYLEPDTTHGMQYLEAVRSVFGQRAGRQLSKSQQRLR